MKAERSVWRVARNDGNIELHVKKETHAGVM